MNPNVDTSTDMVISVNYNDEMYTFYEHHSKSWSNYIFSVLAQNFPCPLAQSSLFI